MIYIYIQVYIHIRIPRENGSGESVCPHVLLATSKTQVSVKSRWRWWNPSQKKWIPQQRHQILKWMDPKPNHYLYRGISTTNQSEGNLFLRSQNISKPHSARKTSPKRLCPATLREFYPTGVAAWGWKVWAFRSDACPQRWGTTPADVLFSSTATPKRCRNGLKTWKFVEEIGNILELTSWKRSLASVSGYLYTYYGHDICVFLLTKIWFLIHCQKNYSTLGRLYPLVN